MFKVSESENKNKAKQSKTPAPPVNSPVGHIKSYKTKFSFFFLK